MDINTVHNYERSHCSPRININEKSAQRQCKHCTLAVVRQSQKFSPHRILPSWGQGKSKFNHLEMVTTFTYTPNLARIDARNFELSW